VPRDDLSARAELERDETPLTATACAACRGLCCGGGGTTAHLQPADIARWRQRAPAATAAEVVDWYLGRLPAETVAGACVFQAEGGCALPRDRRSDRCNSHYCRPLQSLRERVDALGQEGDPMVVMIVDDEAADEARGVVGWSAATGGVGFVAIGAAGDPAPGA
jgi:hypothetical protein